MKHDGENLKKTRAWVRTIPLADAKNLIQKFHYSKSSSNTATFRHGLFYDALLIGCAVWIPPTRSSAESLFRDDWRSVLSLSRLVVAPGSPRNSASYLLSKSIRMISEDGRFRNLVTYADRWQGHTGAIYRATGWTHVGATPAYPVWVNEEGVMMGRKRGPRTITNQEMEELGFRKIGNFKKEKFILRLPERKNQKQGII